MKIEDHERKIQDLEAENQVLKQQLEESCVKTGEDKVVQEKVWMFSIQPVGLNGLVRSNSMYVAGIPVNHIQRNSINYSIMWKNMCIYQESKEYGKVCIDIDYWDFLW